MASFVYVSWEQAVAYREHVRAREPYRLRSLAEWMAATGGPLDAADASFASLVPVWEWFVGFVLGGAPGMDLRLRMPFLTAEAMPDGWPGDRGEVPELGARAQAAAVGLEHYLRLVWERYDPPAPWEIYVTPGRARPDFNHHSTGVRKSNGNTWIVDAMYTLAWNVIADRVHSRQPEALLEWLFLVSGWSEAPEQAPAASVLAPLLHADLAPEPEQSAVSPVWSWPADYWKAGPGTGEERRVGQEMTLWRGPAASLDDAPTLLDPLPVDDLMRVLAAHGFTGAVSAVSAVGAATLLTAADEDGVVELGHWREAGQVELLVAGGALRSLHVEPWAFTKAEWSGLTKDLRAVARRVGARFVADDRIGD
ncbi:hypothetical protein [Cellulomonas hominis]